MTRRNSRDNLFLEPNLIILIFVISHWLLIWTKAFGGEPKGQVPPPRQSPAPPRAQLRLCQEEGPVPSPKAVTRLNSPSRPQAACVYNQLLLATWSLLASRDDFASTYVAPSPFLKMDLNQEASRNEDEMRVFRGIQKKKKYSLGKMQ